LNESTSYKYCPSCREEYRHDFDRCADCDVALVSPDQLADASSPQFPEATEMMLLSHGARAWVEILAKKLREAGVAYRMESLADLFDKGLLKTETRPTGEGIFVQPEHFPQANEIASQHVQEDLATISEDAGVHETDENSCPACGHSLAPQDEECSDCGLSFLAG
jgi:hypothetical protein